MTIVRASRPDLREIIALQYLAYQSEAELHDNYAIPPLTQTYDEVVREWENGLFLKAVDDNGEIIGSIRGYVENNTAYLNKVIVHPKKQGQGIGTQLLLTMERTLPAERYELFTSSKSVRNIRLYARLGYVRFAERPAAEGLTFVYLEKYAK